MKYAVLGCFFVLWTSIATTTFAQSDAIDDSETLSEMEFSLDDEDESDPAPAEEDEIDNKIAEAEPSLELTDDEIAEADPVDEDSLEEDFDSEFDGLSDD